MGSQKHSRKKTADQNTKANKRQGSQGGSVPAMQSIALKKIVAIAAALVLLTLTQQAFAQDDAFDVSVPKPDAVAGGPANLECSTEMLTGSGPGFTADRDKAETMAMEDWKAKAAKVFPDIDLDFDIAKDSNLSCAVQGLYLKCFADGIPCKPKAE